MILEKQLRVFQSELPTLLAVPGNRGRFALVSGDQIDSLWATEDEALAAGYERFGLELFLVKEVTDDETPRHFSRTIRTCR